MREVQINISSPGVMLVHNERLANTMDPIAKDMATITSKRKKTDDDRDDLARHEFYGGLYTYGDRLLGDSENVPSSWEIYNKTGIPLWNVFVCLKNGAKLNRLGTTVDRAVLPFGEDMLPLHHDGPNNPFEMWTQGFYDQRSVKVSTAKVTRTRPKYVNWSTTARFLVDTELLNIDDFKMIAINAGRTAGLGTYRPRFGRFEVEVIA
jgi:hypothetical protein